MFGVVVFSGPALEVGGDLDEAHQEGLVAGGGGWRGRHVEVVAAVVLASHDLPVGRARLFAFSLTQLTTLLARLESFFRSSLRASCRRRSAIPTSTVFV